MRYVPGSTDHATYRVAQPGPDTLDSGEGHPCCGLTCETGAYFGGIVGGELEISEKESDGFERKSVNVWLVSRRVNGFDCMVETSDSSARPEPGWSITCYFRVEEDEAWNEPWIANPGFAFRGVICHSCCVRGFRG